MLKEMAPGGQKVDENDWIERCVDQKASTAASESDRRKAVRVAFLTLNTEPRHVHAGGGKVWLAQTDNFPADIPESSGDYFRAFVNHP